MTVSNIIERLDLIKARLLVDAEGNKGLLFTQLDYDSQERFKDAVHELLCNMGVW